MRRDRILIVHLSDCSTFTDECLSQEALKALRAFEEETGVEINAVHVATEKEEAGLRLG